MSQATSPCPEQLQHVPSKSLALSALEPLQASVTSALSHSSKSSHPSPRVSLAPFPPHASCGMHVLHEPPGNPTRAMRVSLTHVTNVFVFIVPAEGHRVLECPRSPGQGLDGMVVGGAGRDTMVVGSAGRDELVVERGSHWDYHAVSPSTPNYHYISPGAPNYHTVSSARPVSYSNQVVFNDAHMPFT
ncbi:hypothetical protein AUP68_09737 [Ilyonectria robusta]